MATTWYWFNDDVAAAGDNVFGSNNWNDSIDGSNDPDGNWGTPGATDTALMDDDYCPDDCTVDANVTIASVTMNPLSGYGGTLTINNAVTLTLTGDSELQGAVVVTGTISVGASTTTEVRATMTGAGAFDFSGNFTQRAPADWSGFTGSLTYKGSGSKTLDATITDQLATLSLNASGTLTLASDITMAALALAAGTFALDSFTATLGAGGISATGASNLNMGSGTLSCGGNAAFTNITVTKGTGTLDLTGDAKVFTPAAQAFYHVKKDEAGETVTVALGDSVTADVLTLGPASGAKLAFRGHSAGNEATITLTDVDAVTVRNCNLRFVKAAGMTLFAYDSRVERCENVEELPLLRGRGTRRQRALRRMAGMVA